MIRASDLRNVRAATSVATSAKPRLHVIWIKHGVEPLGPSPCKFERDSLAPGTTRGRAKHDARLTTSRYPDSTVNGNASTARITADTVANELPPPCAGLDVQLIEKRPFPGAANAH